MNYRKLKANHDFKVSEIGFGCASFWGLKLFNETKAIALVHQAIEQGVSLFDSGHSYSNGHAEIRLGRALQGINANTELCISTKAGTRIANNGKLFNDFSPTWIEKSAYQSLKNLQLEQLGIFHLHGPNTEDLNDDLYQKLTSLKEKGVVKYLSINVFDEDIIRQAAASQIFDCVMLDYNFMSQQREKIIDELHAQGIAIIAAAPLAGSLYGNRIFKIKGLRDLWYLARAIKNSSQKITQARKYKFINQYTEFTGAQVAIAFVLNNPKICSTVFGSTNPIHLQENLQACDIELPMDILSEINKVK